MSWITSDHFQPLLLVIVAVPSPKFSNAAARPDRASPS